MESWEFGVREAGKRGDCVDYMCLYEDTDRGGVSTYGVGK